MEKAVQPKEPKSLLRSMTASLKNLGGWDLWKSFLICLGGAFVSYSIQRAWGKSFWAPIDDFLSHIPVAFLVAGILTLTIEYHARKRTQEFERDIAADVFRGLLNHIVSPAIFDEIDSFLRAPWVRKGCEYIITFDRPYPEMPDDYFVIRRETSFEVENLTAREVDFPVKSSYSAHPDRTPEAWKRDFHLKLVVRDTEIELAPLVSKGVDFVTLSYDLRLKPKESVRVYLCGEEPSRLEAGSNSYTQGTTAISIRVDVKNLYPDAIRDIGVYMHHPAHEQMTQWIGRYELSRAFLPGQGFEIRWRTARRTRDAEQSEARSG